MCFIPDRGAEDALFIMVAAIARSIEFNAPLFLASLNLASLGLKKAFDIIKGPQLFEALEVQGVSRPYLALLAEIHGGQRGKLQSQRPFDIWRGV
eukprot:9215175-Pyramimonas_sp.AAC.1